MTAVGLLLIGIVLILININTIRKEKNSFNTILDNSENNMKDFELEIGKLRKEFAETILELQQEIEELKANREVNIEYKSVENIDVNVENIDENNNDLYKDEKNVDNILNNKGIEHENIINDINYDVVRNKNESSVENVEKTIDKDKRNTKGHNSVKVDEISKLLNEGLNVEEIAEKIGMGKGEVILIKELYIK